MSVSPITTRNLAVALAWLCALNALPAMAQSSASYKLSEAAFNNAGNPSQLLKPSSASYRVSLDAIGDEVIGSTLTSASFRAESGFVVRYRPPGEAQQLRFTTKTTLAWNPERSVGAYNLYRSTLASLPGNFGSCYQPALGSPSFVETATPASGTGWFYLVTAKNRLREEGSKGKSSNGVKRANAAPCP